MTFRKAIWLSVILHGLILVVSVTRTFFAPSEPIQLQDAIRVDIVGLPQKIEPDQALPPEPAPAAAKPAPKAEAPQPPAPPPPPPAPEAPKFVEKPKPEKPKVEKPNAKPVDVKKSQQNALNHLREMDAFAKLEKAAAERRAAEAKAAAAAEPKARAPIAGHKVTAGNSLTGIPRLEYDRYGAELKARVLGNWAVPAWLMELELSARVRVWLDDAGHVTKKQITRSSGNDVFDAAALDAVDKSDPFPTPPENLRGVLAAEGFTLGLPK